MKPVKWLMLTMLCAAGAHAQDAPAYHPGVGDLMTALVQPRHIKLWIARQRGNWDYAEYERKNLAEMLAKIGKNTPIYRKLDLPGLISSSTGDQLTQLQIAIKDKNATAFDKAYASLTEGCNSCHQATGQGAVHIKVPTDSGAAFIDQDFSPQPSP